jgi:GAF domain-containing protein
MKNLIEKRRQGAFHPVFRSLRSEVKFLMKGQRPGMPSSASNSPPSRTNQEIHARDDQARLEALYHVTRVLGTSLDLDEVLSQVMDAVIRLTSAERGILVLVESESQGWTLRVARNIDQNSLSTWEKEISHTIIDIAVNTRKGVVTGDAQRDPRFSTKASVRLNVLRSMMCTPLLVRGQVIGAIYVDSRVQKSAFNEKDLEMMDAFATQAAFAIDNARVYTQTRQQVQQLTIKLDEAKRSQQVAEITGTEYYRQLKDMAEKMRNRSSKP